MTSAFTTENNKSLKDIIQKYEYTIPDNILFLIHKFPNVNMQLIDLYLSQNKKVPNVLYSNIKYLYT